MFLFHFDTLVDESSIENSTGNTEDAPGVFLKDFLRQCRVKLEEQLSQRIVKGYDYLKNHFSQFIAVKLLVSWHFQSSVTIRVIYMGGAIHYIIVKVTKKKSKQNINIIR